MQQGDLMSGPVTERTSRVMVNGVRRPHRSWDVSRELAGDLPEQVSMLAGITAATGSVAWAREAVVSDRPLTPFGDPAGWLPGKGDRVEIWEGDGASEWRVFTGLIDSTTGDTTASPVSKIVDDIDKLEARFSHAPLQRVMPPRQRAATAYRGIGLKHLYFVDAALRAAGFFALPPAEARQAVSVPAQSSMWPEVGTLVSGTVGGVAGGGASWAVTHDGPDGTSIANVAASYVPSVRLPFGEQVRLSMTVAQDHAGTATMRAEWGADAVVLAIAGSRTAIARLNGVEVCRLALGAGVRVSLHINGSTWELRTDAGATATGTASKGSSTALLDLVTIAADAASRVAGFHVCFTSSSTRWDYTSFTPTARYDLTDRSLLGIMDAAPGIESTTVSALLSDISAATLSAMWIDELGIFQWAPSRSLTGRAPARVLTTAEDVLSVPWRDDLQSVRSRIVVKHRLPACTRSLWDNILWHQGGVRSIEQGQVSNDFITPDSDADWVGEMGPVLQLGDPGSAVPASAGWGSLVGGILATGDTEALATMLTATVAPITEQTWRIRHTVGTVPTGSKVELRFPRESTTIWPRWWGVDLPIIRGFAKTEWTDIDTTSQDRYWGPAWAPVLTHDLGPWINTEDVNTVPQRFADALAVQTRAPAPVITGMGTVADPRLQLGDVLEVHSDSYIGARFVALVTAVRNAHDGAASQEVSVRLLSVQTTLTTYQAWNAEHEGTLTYDQFAALTAQTYNAFRQDYS